MSSSTITKVSRSIQLAGVSALLGLAALAPSASAAPSIAGSPFGDTGGTELVLICLEHSGDTSCKQVSGTCSDWGLDEPRSGNGITMTCD